MSTLAVVTSSPPFVEGGHLVIARSLVAALRDGGPPGRPGGDAAEPVRAAGGGLSGDVADRRRPDARRSAHRPGHLAALSQLRRAASAARVLAAASDARVPTTSGTRSARPLSWKGRLKENARRRLVWAADRYLLAHNVSKLFVISATVQRRLETFGGIRSEVLYPPAPQRAYRVDDYEPYLFAVSRFTPLKRMSADCRGAGAAGGRRDSRRPGRRRRGVRRRVSAWCAERGLGERVSPARAAATRPQLVDHLARCRAVVFPPFDEDYGFVTVEAFASAKPVITCTDSGGPTELVQDGVCGPGRASPRRRHWRERFDVSSAPAIWPSIWVGRKVRFRPPDLAGDGGAAAASGKLIAHGRRPTALARVAVSTIAVVTSSPPLVEGGHLVIARSLVAALVAEGHRRSRRDAPEPLRPAGGGLSGDVADRRRPDARRSAHRPGHLAALSKLDEDYGFVTVEAFSAARPVVTCADSGGPAELVVDGTSGFVVEPTPAALAAAFRRLMDDRDLAARLGQAGLAVASRLTWPETVRKLVIV